MQERLVAKAPTTQLVQEQGIEKLLATKAKRAETILTSRPTREQIVNLLYYWACNQAKPDRADAAVCLGTSLSRFPAKFRSRVSWSCQLFQQGKVGHIVFTGRSDHETQDLDQAAEAELMAVREFGIPEEVVYTVGGDNTQENIIRVRGLMRELDLDWSSLLLVSDNRHLIRTMALARREFDAHVRVFSEPVGGVCRLDPDNWRVIIELIKAVVYNRTLFGLPASLGGHRDTIREDVDRLVGRLTLGASLLALNTDESETPFEATFGFIGDLSLKHN